MSKPHAASQRLEARIAQRLARLTSSIALTACSVAPVSFTPSQGPPDAGGPTTATITIRRDGAAMGAVSAQGLELSCGVTCSATVAVGSVITLTASPGTGAVFGGWTGAACPGGDPICTVTVTADLAISARFDVAHFDVGVGLLGSGTGRVTSSPDGVTCPSACNAAFAYNTAITLTASAAPGSTFLGWGGACTGTGSCAMTATAHTNVTAAFAANNDLVVSSAGNGSGTVTSAPPGILCGPDCAESFAPGTVVTLSALAASDSTFTGWSGGGCSGTGTCQVTVTAAVMITARFALQPRTLTVLRVGGGGGVVTSNPAGIACEPDCTEAYDAHTPVTLTASPDATSIFTGWAGGGCSGTGTCSVTLDDPVAVTASFARKQFMLTVALAGAGAGAVQSSPGGVTCPSDCTELYDAGTVVTLTATPSPGSAFSGWLGACTGTATCTVTLGAQVEVTAGFTIRGRLVTVDIATARLQRLDPSTLALTDIGPLGISFFIGECAWNPADATLYFDDALGGQSLYRLDLNTGAASLVGSHAAPGLASLGYHPPTGKLYAVGYSDRNLYSLSTTTGASTLIGPTGAPQLLDGLAWDSRRQVFTAMIAGSGELYSIDVATGTATRLPQQPPTSLANLGFTYDPVIDRFWVVDNNSNVAQLDPNDGFSRTARTAPGQRTCIAFIP
jgi:hypothetical protein